MKKCGAWKSRDTIPENPTEFHVYSRNILYEYITVNSLYNWWFLSRVQTDQIPGVVTWRIFPSPLHTVKNVSSDFADVTDDAIANLYVT